MEYALIKNNKVENVIVADPDFIQNIFLDWDHIEPLDTLHEQGLGVGVGWSWNEIEGFIAPVITEPEPEPIPVVDTWKITKLAFKNRFPRNKWIAAKIASANNPVLSDFFETFELSTFIDLQRQDTISSVNTLKDVSTPESFRLTQEEVDAVLLVPAQPDEIPSL